MAQTLFGLATHPDVAVQRGALVVLAHQLGHLRTPPCTLGPSRPLVVSFLGGNG